MKSLLPFRAWTAAEDALLRDLYPRFPVAEVADRLGRTVQSLRKRAQALHIQTWHLWTEADRERLREMYGRVPCRQIARDLRRTPLAVKQQAMKLGLDAGRLYTPDEIALVRELPTDSGGLKLMAEALQDLVDEIRVTRARTDRCAELTSGVTEED